jgi:hypothetical protein
MASSASGALPLVCCAPVPISMSQMSCRGSHNLKESPADLQALTAIQQNNFTPQAPHSRGPLTLTVCVTTHPSTTSRQHYFHRTAPVYMERSIYFRAGRWERRQSVDLSSADPGLEPMLETRRRQIGPSSLHCIAILQFARGLRGFPTEQEHKADRIMARQNHAESNTRVPVLNDSVRP